MPPSREMGHRIRPGLSPSGDGFVAVEYQDDSWTVSPEDTRDFALRHIKASYEAEIFADLFVELVNLLEAEGLGTSAERPTMVAAIINRLRAQREDQT